MTNTHAGCISEKFSYPFEQDLPLLPYIKEHSTIFGRNWLFKDIESYVRLNKPSQKGVLITADIGYGKSAFVKELLCATTESYAYDLRSKIVAFHLCKFDVPSTKDPVRFIMRLLGFLSTRFPEFGGILSTIPEHAIVYDNEKCRKEIIACFDQGIINPLSEITEFTDHKLIVIDALDECFDSRINDNELHQLLNARYRKMPTWIKFIVTSRNETRLVNRIRHLKHFHLNSYDSRNVDDISQFINSMQAKYSVLGNFTENIDSILHANQGNFLLVKHFIQYVTTGNALSEKQLPASLADVYEINFERVFPSLDEYESAKPILEIIVASLHPLSRTEVVYILNALGVSNPKTTNQNFEKISFCFQSFEEITFIHQSWQYWLLSEENVSFQISQTNGHSMLSRYLLHQHHNSQYDIVNIAIHIGNSNDLTLKKAFESTFSSKNVTKSTLHKLVWKSDSVTALELILNLKVNVDSFNKGNVTPAFIASARGHLEQLKSLQLHGANLNFKVNDSYLMTSEAQVELIQREYYFGYGLIHIATQFGHDNIVAYLVQQNRTSMRVPNGLGISVLEMACANGHIRILRLLLELKSDIGYCLYYAARNGQNSIVSELIRIGISTSCITEVEAKQARVKGNIIDYTKSILNPTNYQYELFNLNKVWWIANKDTPLHAAIEANFEETAIALIKAYPNFIECVNGNGMTPFLLSVVYDRMLVFIELINRATLDRCSKPSMSITEANMFACPVGGGYAHLDGIYRRFELTKVLYQKHVFIDWLLPDSNLDTAVHYAACSGNILFLYVIERHKNIIFANIHSGNYSTPYHSAAICGAYISMHAMTDGFNRRLPTLVDNQNKNVLMYIVLREFSGFSASIDRQAQYNSLKLFKRLLDSGISTNMKDSYKRNILHYAFKNGHYEILEYMFTTENNAKISEKYITLLTEEDSDGHTPVTYAIEHGAYWNDHRHVSIPRKCVFYDIFFRTCSEEDSIDEYVNSWEAGLIIALQKVPDYVKDDFIYSFKDIAFKSPYLVTAVLVYLKSNLDLNIFRKQFINGISEATPSLSILAVARHTPELFSTCGHLFLDSPHHCLAYKYQSNKLFFDGFLNLAFERTLNKNMLSCADSRGYNVFHYALIGGNIPYAIQLLSYGVNVKNKQVAFKDVVWMMLLGKQKSSYIEYENNCSDQLSCMDYLLGNLMKRNLLEDLTYSDLCFKNSNSLSLVHVLAASGMANSMHVLRQRFGKSIMFCRNNYMVTPGYLWNIMNRHSFMETFHLTSKRFPDPNTETMLILGLLNDFPPEIFKGTLRCLERIETLRSINRQTCFALVDVKVREFYRHFSIHLLLQNIFIDALYLSALDQYNIIFVDWYNRQTIEVDNMLKIKIYAIAYYKIFLELKMPFNYPELRHIIFYNLNKTACDSNKTNLINVYCIRLLIEIKHMLKRINSYAKDFYIQHFIYILKFNQNMVEKDYVFLNKRMAYLGVKGFRWLLNYNTFSRRKDQTDNIIKYRYLAILKSTVKYRYFKESVNHLQWNFTTVNIAHHVPKPFEDIMQYLNVTSYNNTLL